MTFTIPSLLDGASPFSDVFVASANNTAITQVNLSSYDLDFTQGNLGFNEFIVQTEATITGSGATISSTDNLTMSFSMSSMNYSQINGDFKYQHFDLGTEETVFDIFQSSFGAGSKEKNDYKKWGNKEINEHQYVTDLIREIIKS